MALVPRGIRYYSFGSLSGYGQAAAAYVRALVNAGIAVQWIPLEWGPERMVVGSWVRADGSRSELLALCGTSGNLADVPTLIARTRAAIAHDTVVVHAPPECWPALFEPGKRNIGMTVWETDRVPAHWLPLLARADRVIVPSRFNRDVFARGGLDQPIHVVAHVRRHCWREFSPLAIAAARAQLGIGAGDRVYYTINAWDPRKNLPGLIRAFAHAFAADDAVALLIKTGVMGHGAAPLYPYLSTRELVRRVLDSVAAETGRPPPRVVLHNAQLDGDAIDLIHALGDVYVSLSRGEGWGLGAFEAATLAKPVLMTGWGGQCEFLGVDWPGAVPYRLAPVPLWPPQRPSYFPSQRWAEPDFDAAVAMLRSARIDAEPMRGAMRAIRERIVRDFAEPVVAAKLLEALA
ncbi:MAG: glycosyltransferase [Proteobacteria bacterium]|nr:glycosyltransferase [Pseudomonadota bacterium]